MLISALVALLPLVAALPNRRSLERRFGPMKRYKSAPDSHDDHWTASPIPAYEETFDMTWHLHAADQKYVDKVLGELTDSSSARYQQWLSAEEALELTKADPLGVANILDYLEAHGIDNVQLSPHNRTVTFTVTKHVANEMLNADYEYHETHAHPHTGAQVKRLASRSVDLPSKLHRNVAFVFPGAQWGHYRRHGDGKRSEDQLGPRKSHLDAAMMARAMDNDRSLHEILSQREEEELAKRQHNAPIAIPIQGEPSVQLSSGLRNCWQASTPTCLRAMYHIPTSYNYAGISIATLNYRPLNYSAEAFMLGVPKLNPKIPSSYQPTYIDIQVPGQPNTPVNSVGEPDLDLQTVAPLVYPMQLYNFLGPNLDDAGFWGAMAQIGQQRQGLPNIPRPDVLSVSYGGTEESVDSTNSFCAISDYIIAQGTTCVASSGDTGAQDINLPALCPHWIGVGAVDLMQDNTVTALQVAEEATDGWTYHGSGGFSQLGQPAPSYQVSALASYRSQYVDPDYGKYQANAATPDVGAMGRNQLIYLLAFTDANGYHPNGFYQYGGTSLACPIVASMMALLDAQRHAQGKGTIGNPMTTFYDSANTGFFRDVTEGNNYSGNGTTHGNTPWPAKIGWDPVAGLGTLLYDRLSAYYQN